MSKFIRHTNCPKCNSSDALALYKTDDDRTTGKCFSCEHFIYNYDKIDTPRINRMSNYIPRLTLYDIQQLPYADKKDRKIDDETVKAFGIRATTNTSTGLQDANFYPYYIKGQLSGYKSRVLPKDFTSIGSIGNIKGCDLFGQSLCQAGGYKILIVEGEEDCLAAYRMLNAYSKHKGTNHKPNVVSLSNGASGAASEIERALPFLNTFKEIIICFDNDKAGKKALADVSALFPGDKFKVMKFSEKDCSDMLVKGKQQEFISAFFNAEKWVPGGIHNIASLRDVMLDRTKEPMTPYPNGWDIFQKMTYGRRFGEVDVFTSGTGSGKSQVFKELMYYDIINTNLTIGCVALEEKVKHTNMLLTGLHLNKRIHLPDTQVTDDEIIKAWDELAKNDRVHFFDKGKELSDMNLLAQIRYMAAGLGCQHIYLDHLNMIVSETATSGDERKRLDETIIKIKNLAIELNVWIGVIVHLRKTDNNGLPYELGAIANVDALKGSSSLKQDVDNVYAIQRNGNHSIEFMRNVLRLHVIKNRFSGSRGAADFLRFDEITGRITPISKPEYEIIERKNRNQDTEESEDF
jgi:twinkle protein